MQALNLDRVPRSFSTRAVPAEEMAGFVPFTGVPRMGDVAVVEVVQIGRHNKIEECSGLTTTIFPGSRYIGVFGNRYATDQYEGYVPRMPVTECDQLSVGGVLGQVVSSYDGFAAPTRVRIVGAVCDRHGRRLHLRDFGLAPRQAPRDGEVILVVGSSMNSGKTMTIGTLARALTAAGYRVAATKITGTAAGRDGRFYADCGASPVLDFTSAGYPSTYLLAPDELRALAATLIGRLREEHPDYILVELADGIFQRETKHLLCDDAFRRHIDHVFFAATDSLSAECGARYLRSYQLPLRAISGTVTRSPLMTQEAEEVTNVPCAGIERLLRGELAALLGRTNPLAIGPVQEASPALTAAAGR